MARRHRFQHAMRGGNDTDDEPTTAAAAAPAVVECSSRSCRSCAAVMLADCIALGCCPCAVFSLLGLALVKAPLVMGRRCIGRLRKKKGRLLHKKRVRDVVEAKCTGHEEAMRTCDGFAKEEEKEEEMDVVGVAARLSTSGLDAEKMWLEMYQVGHWGFGRLSFSGNPS